MSETARVPSNADLLRDAIAAINRGDAQWLVDRSDPEIELHMVGVAGEPVRYDGHAGIREWLADLDEIWDSIEFVVNRIDERGDRVVAIVDMRFRGRASGLEVEARTGLVCDLRDGKAVRLQAHPDAEGLEDT